MFKTKLTPKKEGTFEIIAAFVVLFTTIWDPLFSAGLAVALLFLLAIYKFKHK